MKVWAAMIVLVAICAANCDAYEVATHVDMTRQAATSSILGGDQAIAMELGLPSPAKLTRVDCPLRNRALPVMLSWR